MKIIGTTFEKLPRERLVIGFEGENLRATVRIDCASVFAEYPNATPTLIVKPLFADAYPVVVDRNGTDVDWLITSEILSFSGDGEIQLVFYKDEVICKSAVSKIRVSRSLQVTGEMPDPVVQWIENANRKLAEVDAQIVELEGMVDTATDAATRAEQSASTASTKAEQAAGSAAIATAKATEATNAATTATAKAAEAEQSALTATEKATAAAESERIATAKAGEATTAAGTATAKAEQATEAAQTATEKAGDASASARAAQESATDAAASATAASESETAAKASETAAGASATQAGTSERNAGTAAQTATQKAAEATQSASNAAASEQTATQKAGEAEASAQTAQEAKTAVEQTAEQLADSLEQIEQNTQDIAEHEQYAEATYATKNDLYKKADIIHNTASGAIASFPDGAEMPVDEVTAQINPVQDLHGYDHPWPAGGGKNLLNLSGYDAWRDYTINSDGTITVSGSDGGAWDNRPTIPLKAGTYTVSYSATSGNLRYKTSEDNYTEEFTTAVSKTFTLTADGGIKFKFGLGASAYPITVKAQLESGSTATDWTPYSNICPITGWDGVQVWDDPRYGGLIEWNQLANVSDGDTTESGVTIRSVGGKITASGTATSLVNHLLSNTAATSGHKFLITNIDSSASFPTYYILFGGNIGIYGVPKIVDGNGSTNGLRLIVTGGQSINAEFALQCFDLTVMFGAGNEPTTVEEFKALFPADYYTYNAGEITTVSAANGDPYRHYSITLPTEAGTVYGGELDVTTGVLTVAHESVDLGACAWGTSTATTAYSSYSITLPHTVKPAASTVTPYNGLCSILKTLSCSSTWTPWSISVSTSTNTGTRVIVPKDQYSTAAEAKADFSGVQLVYELAEPLTYQLTPTEIRTLLGTNNVWADTGNVSVKYNADTKLYIDNKITQAIAAAMNS